RAINSSVVTTSALSLFFLYSYRHHPDLHSFPTRRSSDLPGPHARHRGGEQYRVRGHCDLRSDQAHVEGGDFAPEETGADGDDGVDRKSTRLNSSHRTISYAVFCLKKKKKNKRNNIHNNTR